MKIIRHENGRVFTSHAEDDGKSWLTYVELKPGDAVFLLWSDDRVDALHYPCKVAEKLADLLNICEAYFP
jgi:hypothetical protein